MSTYRVVPLSSVSTPAQPLRTTIERDGIDELAASIARVGLIEPLIVKEIVNGYEVLAGHRRLLACRIAGLPVVEVMIRADDTDVEAVVTLCENIQRADLTPVEEARAIDKMRKILGRSMEEIAHACGRSEAWVRGRVELLTWPSRALEAVADGRATVTALRPLVDIENPVERDRLLDCAIAAGATANVTRAWAAQAAGFAADSPETMGTKARALLPLGDVVVVMPCYCCRENSNAFELAVIRICRGCIEDLENSARVGPSAGVAVGGGGET